MDQCAMTGYLNHDNESSNSIEGGDIVEQLSYYCNKCSFVQNYSSGETW
jgi:hypothetical protein